jgi:hypothetical protein
VKNALLWPLWSPRRLGLTAVALVAVLGILGGCAGAGHSKPAHRAPTGTTSQTPDPTPFLTPPASHAVDEATAVKFVSAYLSHAPNPGWLATIQALATPAAAASLTSVNPTTVQGTKVTGSGTWSQAGIDVPTDAGSVTVTVDPSGLVSDIQPAATGAPNVARGR